MDLLGNALSEGLLPAIVVAVYLIIIRIIDNKRDEQQIKITNQLVDSINKISKFLDHVTDSIIDKDNGYLLNNTIKVVDEDNIIIYNIEPLNLDISIIGWNGRVY